MDANYFTILYWFCHTSTWIHHGCTHVPHPEPRSHLPPRTIPLGRLSAPAPSIQYHASNLDWWFVSYMILYMFQCHFIFDQLMLRKFFLKIMWSLFLTESLGSIWIVLIVHPQKDNLMCLQKVIIVLSGLPFCSLFNYSWDNVVSTIFLWTT